MAIFALISIVNRIFKLESEIKCFCLGCVCYHRVRPWLWRLFLRRLPWPPSQPGAPCRKSGGMHSKLWCEFPFSNFVLTFNYFYLKLFGSFDQCDYLLYFETGPDENCKIISGPGTPEEEMALYLNACSVVGQPMTTTGLKPTGEDCIEGPLVHQQQVNLFLHVFPSGRVCSFMQSSCWCQQVSGLHSWLLFRIQGSSVPAKRISWRDCR